MDISLYQYLVTPMVVRTDEMTELTIRPLDPKYAFDPTAAYTISIRPLTRRTRRGNHEMSGEPESAFMKLCREAGQYQGESWKTFNQTVTANVTGDRLTFRASFDNEESYTLVIFENGKARDEKILIYALDPDLYALRPLKGDFHVHSCRSDGKESPTTVAANYRAAGFDFTSLSDHGQYAPSAEMIDAFAGVKHDLLLVNGEEVHAPENFVHIIHFGGVRSVNEQFRKEPERFFREVSEIAASEEIPYFDRFLYAANLWCVRRIREAGGLAVYCHPHWTYYGQQNDPDELSRLFLRRGEFDAFELIGGQISHENDLQIALWNDLRAEGVRVPALGASDSHGTINSGLFNQMFTVVFAKEKSVASIIEAVRAGRTAPVEYRQFPAPPVYYDYHEPQYSVHGDYRTVAYTRFLLDNYFPRVAVLTNAEGLYMREYILGIDGARERLEALSGRTDRFYREAFGR